MGRRIEKFVNGKRIQLASQKAGYTPNRAYHVKFHCAGAQLSVWIDGQRVLSAVDTSFNAGKIGFLAYADNGLVIDDVEVTRDH